MASAVCSVGFWLLWPCPLFPGFSKGRSSYSQVLDIVLCGLWCSLIVTLISRLLLFCPPWRSMAALVFGLLAIFHLLHHFWGLSTDCWSFLINWLSCCIWDAIAVSSDVRLWYVRDVDGVWEKHLDRFFLLYLESFFFWDMSLPFGLALADDTFYYHVCLYIFVLRNIFYCWSNIYVGNRVLIVDMVYFKRSPYLDLLLTLFIA